MTMNYRIMMRKKGKDIQILTTQCENMDDAVAASLGIAKAASVEDMDELCIHEYGPNNVVRMLDAKTGVVEIAAEGRAPKDIPKIGQVIKSKDREAEIEQAVDDLIAKYGTGEKSVAVDVNVAPLTQVKVRNYRLLQLACVEPPEKKGYGGRNG